MSIVYVLHRSVILFSRNSCFLNPVKKAGVSKKIKILEIYVSSYTQGEKNYVKQQNNFNHRWYRFIW